MFAVVVEENEDRSLVWREVETPTPGAGQVRIRIAASAVNRADLLQRKGRYPVPPGASPIMGLEASGVIDALGDGVSDWAVGDEVCVLLEGGGYAEQVVVDASMLLPVPEGLTPVEAAALPEVFYTAWLNIFIEGAAQPGETVVVHAAASGVGTAATQLCRLKGNPCIATASADKLARCLELGADHAIDRRAEDFFDQVRAVSGGADVILDPVGASYLDMNVRLLKTRGRIVLIGLLGGATAEVHLGRLLMKRGRLIGSVLRSRSRAEKEIITASIREHVWPYFATKELVPVIEAILPITDAQAAHERLAGNKTTGKLVLTVG